DWMNNCLTFHDTMGIEHTWNASEDLTGDLLPEDYMISAMQMKEQMRDPRTKGYMCMLMDIDEFEIKLEQAMENQPEYLQQVLTAFPEVFGGVSGMLPSRDTDHKIDLLPGSTPPFGPLYHMSEKELTPLKEESTCLLQLGHIRRSSSPYGAPIF